MTQPQPTNPELSSRAKSLISSRAGATGEQTQDNKTTFYSNEFEERAEIWFKEANERLYQIEQQLNDTPKKKARNRFGDILLGCLFMLASYEYGEARGRTQAETVTIAKSAQPTLASEIIDLP